MANDPKQAAESVDVEALMRDLRRRVAEKKARGLYTTDALARDAMEGAGGSSPGDTPLAHLEERAILRQRLIVGPSTRPVVGKAVEKIKRFVVRASFDSVADITGQQTRFNAEAVRAVKTLTSELEALRALIGEPDPSRRDALVERQNAALVRALSDAGEAALVVPGGAEAVTLGALPDASSGALGIVAASGDPGVEELEALATQLARVVAPGGQVAISPGTLSGVAVAALLRAVGFARADILSLAPHPDAPTDACIVVAER